MKINYNDFNFWTVHDAYWKITSNFIGRNAATLLEMSSKYCFTRWSIYRGGHSTVKLNTTCDNRRQERKEINKLKWFFYVMHHQNVLKFYQVFSWVDIHNFYFKIKMLEDPWRFCSPIHCPRRNWAIGSLLSCDACWVCPHINWLEIWLGLATTEWLPCITTCQPLLRYIGRTQVTPSFVPKWNVCHAPFRPCGVPSRFVIKPRFGETLLIVVQARL